MTGRGDTPTSLRNTALLLCTKWAGSLVNE